MKEIQEQIMRLKKEKNAVIMAHYYVDDAVQEIADYVGDSYYLSDMATKVEAETIVLCGVSFMGESAKILNPGKRVLLPDVTEDRSDAGRRGRLSDGAYGFGGESPQGPGGLWR